MSKQESDARRARADRVIGLVGVAIAMAATLCGQWTELVTPPAIVKQEQNDSRRQLPVVTPEHRSFWISPQDRQVIPGTVHFEAVVTDLSVNKVHFAASQVDQDYVVVCADDQPDANRSFGCDWDPAGHPLEFDAGQIGLLYMEERDGQFSYGSRLTVLWDWARGLMEVYKSVPLPELAAVAN